MKRVFLVATVLAQCAMAAGPVITELRPRGVERGKPFTLTVAGRDLAPGTRVWSTLPAAFTPVVSSKPAAMMAEGRSASFLVEPDAAAAPGVYLVRVEGPNGISNALFFTVGTFPELTELESDAYSEPYSNDSIEKAEPMQSVPVTVNGTLRGAERDVFRISGKAGERRVFEVEARRCGSAIDPVIRILDGAGKQLARTDDSKGAGLDALLEFTFPKEGYYYVEVHDARYSRQTHNFYRLKMGSFPYAETMFPLGGRRGETVEVTFSGGNLPQAVKTAADLRTLKDTAAFTTVGVPDSPVLPFRFAVSDLPELLEPSGSVPVPSVINGRLLAAGEIDRYKIVVKPGEKLLFEVQARELGTSKIEAILTVFDGAGKKIDSAGDKPLLQNVNNVQGNVRSDSDPFLNLAVPENVSALTLSIEDLALRGGPEYGYRILVRRQAEDFRLALATPNVNIPSGGTAFVGVAADRLGYQGPIQLTVPNLPKGIRMEGGIIPAEPDPNDLRLLSRRGGLILSAEPGVELALHELTVVGTGKTAEGLTLERRAAGPGLSIGVLGATAQGVVDRQRSLNAAWLGLALPSATTLPPPATLDVKQVKVTRMEEGDRYDYEYVWRLLDSEARVPAKLNVDAVGARDLRITAMERGAYRKETGSYSGSFSISTTKATDPAHYDLIVRGTVKTANGDEEVYARPIPFIVEQRSSKTDAPTGQ